MKISKLFPLPEKKVHFKLSSFQLVPKRTGCYVLTTFENEILYIGLTGNLFDRFQQHLQNPEKTTATIQGRAVWFYFTFYDPINLPKLERSWLNQFLALHGEMPVLNKVSSPVS